MLESILILKYHPRSVICIFEEDGEINDEQVY